MPWAYAEILFQGVNDKGVEEYNIVQHCGHSCTGAQPFLNRLLLKAKTATANRNFRRRVIKEYVTTVMFSGDTFYIAKVF